MTDTERVKMAKKTGRRNIRAIRDPAGFNAAAIAAPPVARKKRPERGYSTLFEETSDGGVQLIPDKARVAKNKKLARLAKGTKKATARKARRKFKYKTRSREEIRADRRSAGRKAAETRRRNNPNWGAKTRSRVRRPRLSPADKAIAFAEKCTTAGLARIDKLQEKLYESCKAKSQGILNGTWPKKYKRKKSTPKTVRGLANALFAEMT